MPFTFKLSKRLALMKASLVPAAAVALATCQLQDRRGITGPTLPSSSVLQVVVAPDTATLEPAQIKQFAAYGRTQAGDSVAITTTWGVTGGAISSGGLYTAATIEGDYQVAATLVQPAAASVVGGPSALTSAATQGGNSVVHVRRRNQLAQIVLVPRSVALGTGGTEQFAAYGILNSGDSVAASVTWGATGGVVSSSGLYTAGLVPGGYVASASSGSITGIALLAVSDVSVASVAVRPASAAVSGGSPQQPTAVVKDADG